MLSRNLDCELNLTGEMNRIFMKTPTRRASPAARSDHAFQSVSPIFRKCWLPVGLAGPWLITTLDSFLHFPLVCDPRTDGELAKRSSASGGQLESAGATRTQLPAKPGEVAARALPPRPVTFNSLIGLALPAASMGTSSLRTRPVPGSSRINRTALSPAAAAAATTVALNGHGGSWAEPASVAGAVFAFTRRRASSVVAVLVYYRRRRPIHSFIHRPKLEWASGSNYSFLNLNL